MAEEKSKTTLLKEKIMMTEPKGVKALSEEEIKKAGGKRIELSAQCRVSQFYLKQGYTDTKDVHMDEYCPHTWMRKELDPACILNEKGK